MSDVQQDVVALLRDGYRLAVREAPIGDGEFVRHTCLVYARDLSRTPPYRHIRWSTVEALLRREAIRQLRVIGGNERYYGLAEES